ncbi:hypothetical protein Nepgr_027835 [Nepenthes gracilis]|uniref:Uncharacterized protein n=1 Tax=Nepenthes gracilis TaxID=150966 RepID=A0AAD3Y1L0_NEPGR|nr:hypothetical protein Nepgr_027835 [Nepenthes gracilis]
MSSFEEVSQKLHCIPFEFMMLLKLMLLTPGKGWKQHCLSSIILHVSPRSSDYLESVALVEFWNLDSYIYFLIPGLCSFMYSSISHSALFLDASATSLLFAA